MAHPQAFPPRRYVRGLYREDGICGRARPAGNRLHEGCGSVRNDPPSPLRRRCVAAPSPFGRRCVAVRSLMKAGRHGGGGGSGTTRLVSRYRFGHRRATALSPQPSAPAAPVTTITYLPGPSPGPPRVRHDPTHPPRPPSFPVRTHPSPTHPSAPTNWQHRWLLE